MSKQHTPAPWEVVVDDRPKWKGQLSIRRAETFESVVYRVDPGSGFYMDRHQADARLIAAAPELLEALEELRDIYAVKIEQGDTYCEICDTHAYKHLDKRGEWNGKVNPINHKPDCFMGKIERVIAKARNG